MDSSKVFEGAEECHSSESGWTMYIGDDHDVGDDGDYAATDDSGDDGSTNIMMIANHEDESDDSMASDASSGPSHHYATGEAHDFKPNKEAEGTGSDKKAKRRMEKQKAEMRKKEEKDQQMILMAKRVSTPAQSDSKARKNVWNKAKTK